MSILEKKARAYLAKRADLERWSLVTGSSADVEQVVVIPALAERDSLFHTLASLACNAEDVLERTLVICVANNRAEPHADANDIANNQDTLQILDALVRDEACENPGGLQPGQLRLAYVDASSPGRELGPKDGVGLARKIGLDLGLSVLLEETGGEGALLSLDADTLVAPDYLSAVYGAMAQPDAWAGVVHFEHRLPDTHQERLAILCYELFLRAHVLGLRYAESPYAFHSVGSTMVCRAEAYVAVSGMNRRQAGEDFYFLQQLAKTGPVRTITSTTVYPDARPSTRVPFGTGMRVRRFLDDASDEHQMYHPDSYRVLRAWLALVTASPNTDATTLLKQAHELHAELENFLEAQGFMNSWQNIQKNARNTNQLTQQFHRWFDGFRTLKLIHHLRDTAHQDQDLFATIATLLDATKNPCPATSEPSPRTNTAVQESILTHLRNADKQLLHVDLESRQE